MEFLETEKRLLYQLEGFEKPEVLHELSMMIRYGEDPARQDTAKSLTGKLQKMSAKECMDAIRTIQKHYRLPEKAQTVGELLAEARQKSGAEKLKGHDIMALERFDSEVRHMIIFDVLSRDSPVGDKGDRMRLFLTDEGYRKFLQNQENGFIKIKNHARVSSGHLHYDRRDCVL